ncbi:hypothetical protein CAC42_4279 [Sphaceloma murrayae]|uniref:Uncharacterized protein n=1 Tax=Sphaceloma murrayae TaxID=2082308 RepID=A0A2K1QL04_9PEZI|nr:hypothetical protein CAC42_4279 [Sphaceloma murrayae]
MTPSSSKKRSRDVEDDFDLTTQSLGKKSRCSGPADSPLSASTGKAQWHFLQSPLGRARTARSDRDDTDTANVSEVDSTTDDSMDLDLRDESLSWSPNSAGRITANSTQSGTSDPSVISITQQQSTSHPSIEILVKPTRPKPCPLQSSSHMASEHAFRPKAHELIVGSSEKAVTDRMPSPMEDDEPHTPTTAAGSQLSLLSVNDMDVDSGSTTPVRQGAETGSFIRKQRQRSGAFISSADVAKRIQFGYRADCEKCRNKVPGHMNHFLGT